MQECFSVLLKKLSLIFSLLILNQQHIYRCGSHLEYQSSLCSKAVLQKEGALVASHAVQNHSQDSTEYTLLQFRCNHSLKENSDTTH